jgi:uncharacterized membrane protein YbhN (UPF0104 family)
MKTFIKILLLIQGIWFWIASFIDAFAKESKPPNWFDYLSLSLFCFSMYAIIKTIENNNSK